MAATRNSQAKEKKVAETKTSPKNKVEKKVSPKRKVPNPSQKRGQPAAAARLVSSPWIKFGWHKPLSGFVKESIQEISSVADSMYMLEVERTRPIESLSMRNALFWEHRQLEKPLNVSTPSVDHLDLFPADDEVFRETLEKIGKQLDRSEKTFKLHYLFYSIRFREYLILPVEINGIWITIVTRTQFKQGPNVYQSLDNYTDMEVTDMLVVDPLPEGRELRRDLINKRFPAILQQGCIALAENITYHELNAPDIDVSALDHLWQTGLVSFAISRELLRRLKVLQYREEQGKSGSDDQAYFWGPFEEHYNMDGYRQSLMAACAHQAIEGSGFLTRLALEVPSEDSNYDRDLLARPGKTDYLADDEKWDVLQSETHTYAIGVPSSLLEPQSPHFAPSPKFAPASPGFSPSSPGFAPSSPVFSSMTPPFRAYAETIPEKMEHETKVVSYEGQLPDADASTQVGVPVAPMGGPDFLSDIPGLDLTSAAQVPNNGAQANAPQENPRKRRSSDDDADYEQGSPAAKKIKIDGFRPIEPRLVEITPVEAKPVEAKLIEANPVQAIAVKDKDLGVFEDVADYEVE
ncbi:hypothetical protein F5Y01DRAFT_146106 [Xylaria sp. FL0043]|nr:hypothetical protein F5Y01DRAFT_146106 [Xylaria sp. FL0043]